MSKTQKAITKAAEALRAGEPSREQSRIAAALDKALDDVEWTEKGLAEWRAQALSSAKHAEAARATARIAIAHLQNVLKDAHARIPSEQRGQWRREASDWLTSIGA